MGLIAAAGLPGPGLNVTSAHEWARIGPSFRGGHPKFACIRAGSCFWLWFAKSLPPTAPGTLRKFLHTRVLLQLSLDHMSAMALLSPAAGATRRVSAPFTSNRSMSAPLARLQPAGAWRIVLQQQRQQAQAGRGALLCRAAGGDGNQKQPEGGEQAPASSSSSSSPASGEAPKRPPVADPSVAKGQLTAIITGAISIAFGVSLPPAAVTGCVAKLLLGCRALQWARDWPPLRMRRLLHVEVALTSVPAPPLPTALCPQVLYLALVQFMDMRGGELLPPPPEAFIP